MVRGVSEGHAGLQAPHIGHRDMVPPGAGAAEDHRTRAGAVTLTALQRIRQVVCLKDKLEQVKGSALTVEEFHKALDRVDYSALSEPVTVNYVKAALEVHKKALSIPAVLDLVLSCEGRRVSLFFIISVGFLVSVSLAFAVVFVNGY